MSYDRGRKGNYGRDRDHDHDWERSSDYRSGGRVMSRKRSRSMTRGDLGKRRSRSPRKNDKDMLDENILSEISKLPEPSELWDNSQGSGYQDSYPAPPPPPSFSREAVNPNYGSNYQQTYSGIYDDFPPLASAPPPPDMSSWNQMSLPPPPTPTPAPAPASYHSTEDQLKKEAAIESEMRHQKAALSKQREDCIKKSAILKKELDTLKGQRNELRGDPKRSPSPDTKRFLKENAKLQLEIQNKLKTINNVVDMLNGIIGEEAQELPELDDSPERKRKSRSPSSNKKVNYVYYDPEMHWCRVCNDFPPTAKDYLNHLHSAAHHKMAAQHLEAPWHSVSGLNEGFPSHPSAPTKRTPIRGLQFFVPSTAWYCKLCDLFIGDLHCASAHLKSVVHSKNYTNFVEQNPHWETDWMSDRQKAFEKARAGGKRSAGGAGAGGAGGAGGSYTAHTITFSKDGFHTKRPKKSPSPQPEESKRKKRDKKKKSKKRRDSSSSSSSASDSSASDSRRKRRKDKCKKLKNIDVTDDKALEEWIASIQVERLSDNDRKLLDNLKTRIRKERDEKLQSTARDVERVKEMQRKVKENERVGSRSREERRGSRERDKQQSRERDTRDTRERDTRERDTRERDARDTRDTRERWDRLDKRDEPRDKKPEVKKMPFIGKMPVFKHLGKTKVEEQKKEEQKKKEESENVAKKKQEMDAEIQRKVAEFKEKIAAAQLERAQQQAAEPPAAPIAPPRLLTQPPVLAAPPAPAPPPVPGAAPLPKDFQEALDIIFPADQKPPDKLPPGVFNIQPPGVLGMPPPMGMPPFPPLPSMGGMGNMGNMGNVGMMQPPGMFGFEMNPLFPPPQLYDSHVPLLPGGNKPRPIKINRLADKPPHKQAQQAKNNGDAAAKKKEELDDLAMLGIDATDVGAGI